MIPLLQQTVNNQLEIIDILKDILIYGGFLGTMIFINALRR